MDFDKSSELWAMGYRVGENGLPNGDDLIFIDINGIGSPIEGASQKYVIHNGSLTVIKVSDDLMNGAREGDSYRSMVRFEVLPRGDAPKELMDLLDKYGFEKVC